MATVRPGYLRVVGPGGDPGDSARLEHVEEAHRALQTAGLWVVLVETDDGFKTFWNGNPTELFALAEEICRAAKLDAMGIA